MPKAIIAGGGIGGLTAALCLVEKGWDVQVLEQASEITEVGAGIQISPNGFKVLRAIGLEQAVIDAGFTPDGNEMRIGKSGKTVFNIPMKEISTPRWGAPYVQIHRGDLIDILSDTLKERAPDAVRTDAHVTGYKKGDPHVYAVLEGGEEIEGDILIGADGIHSRIRHQMHGTSQPRFTGNVAWRVVVPTEKLGDLLPPKTGCAWVGPGRHAVTYYLRQGKLVNLVGVVERDDWQEEGWTIPGTMAEALADFEEFHPVIANIIKKGDSHYRWALHDRAPLSHWSDGAVGLMGDACHPMLPFLAQGAVMAMEDAYVLAKHVSSGTDYAKALKAYDQDRLDRTANVQAGARLNMGIFHQRTKIGQLTTYGPMKLAATFAPGLVHSRWDWIYGHDVTKD